MGPGAPLVVGLQSLRVDAPPGGRPSSSAVPGCADTKAVSDEQWSDDLLLDENFVQAARYREASGHERAQRAARIGREHQAVQPWRAPVGGQMARRRVATGDWRRQPYRRGWAGILVAVVVVTGGWYAGLLHPGGSVGTGGDLASMTEVGQAVPFDEPLALRRLLLAVPTPKLTGTFAFLAGGRNGSSPLSWNPCQPIRWVQRPDARVPGGTELLTAAVSEVSAVTGLAFAGGTESNEAPTSTREAYQPNRYGPQWAPVLVAWSDPQHSPELAGDVAGVAGPVTFKRPGQPQRYVTGQVVLDAPQLAALLTAPSGADEVHAVILHELGHLVGLAHVDDSTELMNPTSTTGSPVTYSAGDLQGLSRLGAGDCT